MEINEEIISCLEEIPTGNFADNNLTGGVIAHPLRALNPSLHMIGRAFTVRGAAGDNLAIYRGLDKAEKGDVLVVDCQGYTGAGHFGDMMAQAVKIKGLAGVIINGTARDYEDILRLELPVYSLGFNPAPTAKEVIGETGTSVEISGVCVHTGDLLIGDGDGVVVIAQGTEEEVIAKARLKHQKEILIGEKLKNGESIVNIFNFNKIIEEKEKNQMSI